VRRRAIGRFAVAVAVCAGVLLGRARGETPEAGGASIAGPVAEGGEGEKPRLPPAVAALTALGLKAFADRDNEKAADTFREIVGRYPDHAPGWMNLGLAEHRLKRPDEAEKALTRAVEIDLRFGPAWLLLGIVRYEKKAYDGALAALGQAVWLEPKNPVARNYLAVTVGAKGWNSGAEEELRRALDLSPDYGPAHFNLAIFYLKRTPPAYELARRHYVRAKELGEAPDPLVEKKLETAKP
jgi:tetratricopeptide (TPR) repeat protein